MKAKLPVLVLIFLLSGCATFKELSPAPELSPAELGYIELRDNKENFTLDKEKKYFIKFPRPESDRFYLVLKLGPKSTLTYYLTNKFDDGDGVIEKIRDEATAGDSLAVYAINPTGENFFWVIDSVKNDVELTMKYRYVPQWRFTFENKYVEYKQVLADNRVDRSTYGSINREFSFDGFPFAERMAEVGGRNQRLQAMEEALVQLAKVFPTNIAASRDTAHLNYLALRKDTEDELAFQENYAAVLKAFKQERDSQGDIAKFLEVAPSLAEFVARKERFPSPIMEKARDVFGARLNAAPGYFDEQLRSKSDWKRISFDPPAAHAKKLYEALGKQVPPDLRNLMSFTDRFNIEAAAMQGVTEKFRQTEKVFDANPPWSSEPLYADLIGKIADIKARIPESKAVTFEKYGRYTCAMLLDGEIRNAASRATASDDLYQAAQRYVQQLNANSWAVAEGTLKEMHYSPAYGSIVPVAEQQKKFVKVFEDELFNRVRTVSQQRVDAFVKANEAAIDNVPALYRDSAFVPAHQISFSAGGDTEIQRRRGEIANYIDKLKFNDFPAASIKAIYRDFTRNINDRGVDRARAIVEHGKYYKGDDKQLRSMVNECDPTVAKWITKPKDYRKVFALPVTTSPRGTNEYLFRVQLQIPSDAQFPVYEINVKLPKEVAEKAGSQQWYESITINKKPIKNEGRFTITAPASSNDYESQVSPVQMDKEGRNILEVRFKFPGYKVFEVSTMAQVPIIRKN